VQINKEDFKENFEFYIAGVFLMITVCVVIMNVFTRYVLSFTFPWAEEIPVDCFVWTIFLGAAGAFKHKMLMGVDFLFHFVKGKTKKVLEIISSALVLLIATTMCVMSFLYVSQSNKITAILCIPYKYINISIVIGFALITVYAFLNLVTTIRKPVETEAREAK